MKRKAPIGNKRKTGKEQYYTIPSVADQCVAPFLRFINETNDYLVEPAGGRGDFIESLKRNNVSEERIISFDIEPHHELVQEQDFLLSSFTSLYSLFETNGKRNHSTISNPPFGRANSLSVKFFNHAASFSNYIGFLVPRSWRKWSIQEKLNKSFHLVHDEEMPMICFYSESPSIPHTGSMLKTVFQVWEHRPNEIRQSVVVEERNYLVTSTPEEADVAVTLFGYSCGRIETDFERKQNSTKAFYKVKNHKVIDALQQIDFSVFSQNVAYTAALSKKEINFLLNQHFDEIL